MTVVYIRCMEKNIETTSQPEPEVWISEDGAPYVHLIRIGIKFYPARIIRQTLTPAERKENRRTYAQLKQEMQA